MATVDFIAGEGFVSADFARSDLTSKVFWEIMQAKEANRPALRSREWDYFGQALHAEGSGRLPSWLSTFRDLDPIEKLNRVSPAAIVRLYHLYNFLFERIDDNASVKAIAAQSASVKLALAGRLNALLEERISLRAERQAAAEQREREEKLGLDLAGWSISKEARVPEAAEDLLGWLALQTPDTWHTVWQACGIEGKRFIVSQPNCDRATAAEIFLPLDMDYSKYCAFTNSSHGDRYNKREEHWQLGRMIAESWSSGKFVRAEIATALDQYRVNLTIGWRKQREACGERSGWDLPVGIFGPFAGREAKSYFTSGEDGHVVYKYDVWKRRMLRTLGEQGKLL
jgi:hypothetical protein